MDPYSLPPHGFWAQLQLHRPSHQPPRPDTDPSSLAAPRRCRAPRRPPAASPRHLFEPSRGPREPRSKRTAEQPFFVAQTGRAKRRCRKTSNPPVEPRKTRSGSKSTRPSGVRAAGGRVHAQNRRLGPKAVIKEKRAKREELLKSKGPVRPDSTVFRIDQSWFRRAERWRPNCEDLRTLCHVMPREFPGPWNPWNTGHQDRASRHRPAESNQKPHPTTTRRVRSTRSTLSGCPGWTIRPLLKDLSIGHPDRMDNLGYF